MPDSETHQLRSVSCPSNGDPEEGGIFFAVGFSEITNITMTQDLQGPHCWLWQINVFKGDMLFVQIPRHNTEAIEYATE